MPKRLNRSVSLTPELDRYLAARVASGAYNNVSEVVRAALRMLIAAEPADMPRTAAPRSARAR